MNLLAGSLDDVGEVIRAQTEARLEERDRELDARLRRIEAQVELGAKYRRITDHRMHDHAYEAIVSGEERPWEWAEEDGVSMAEEIALAEGYRNA